MGLIIRYLLRSLLLMECSCHSSWCSTLHTQKRPKIERFICKHRSSQKAEKSHSVAHQKTLNLVQRLRRHACWELSCIVRRASRAFSCANLDQRLMRAGKRTFQCFQRRRLGSARNQSKTSLSMELSACFLCVCLKRTNELMPTVGWRATDLSIVITKWQNVRTKERT